MKTPDVCVVATAFVFLPERQVQSVVFVLQQLFHRKHGGSQHVHLTHTHPEDLDDSTYLRVFFPEKLGRAYCAL